MKRKITYDEAVAGHGFRSYQEEVSYLLGRMEDGTLKPVKSSGTNGRYPAMYLRYWEILPEVDAGDLEEELRYRLATQIRIDYYLQHLPVYRKERPWVLRLSNYLKTSEESLQTPISVNERSFAIWGREKFLSGVREGEVSAATILAHCGLDMSCLNTYETAEPLATYVHTRETPQVLLISENLDPFCGMRRYLLSGREEILGIPVGTLVYGGGQRVARSFQDMELLAEPYMLAPGNHFLYVGDLDYVGIQIFENFHMHFRESVWIEPFVAYYELMLRRAEQRLDGGMDALPRMKAGQNRQANAGEVFLSFFQEKEQQQIRRILAEGQYIPQEILSVRDYHAV
ncbi:MAG: hypothetical protein IJT34_07085 [Butyrivibrio sp.]|nr:hypothetical protein [Butyrivibrio sp.]